MPLEIQDLFKLLFINFHCAYYRSFLPTDEEKNEKQLKS